MNQENNVNKNLLQENKEFQQVKDIENDNQITKTKIKKENFDFTYKNKLNTLQEPVYTSIMRDIKQILRRVRLVIIPFGKGNKLKNWDLWGPLILCISFAWTLSLASSATVSTIIFGTVFCVIWVGSAVIAINAQLLGGNISFFHCVCTLGYSLFPMNIVALISILLKRHLDFEIILSLVVISYLWSCRCASIYMQGLVHESVKGLVLFPVYLFYIFLAFFMIQLTQS